MHSGAIWFEGSENRQAPEPRTDLGAAAARTEVHQVLANCLRLVRAPRSLVSRPTGLPRSSQVTGVRDRVARRSAPPDTVGQNAS